MPVWWWRETLKNRQNFRTENKFPPQIDKFLKHGWETSHVLRSWLKAASSSSSVRNGVENTIVQIPDFFPSSKL